MDLASQATSVWLRRWWILGAALLVALVVFGIRMLTPPTYLATVAARVDVREATGGDPAQTITYLSETVVGLAVTPPVLADAQQRADLPITTSEVAARTSVNQTKAPGLLSVSATGPNPADATQLAQAMADAVTARMAADAVSFAAAAVAPLHDQIEALKTQIAALPARDTVGRAILQRRSDALDAAITDIQSRPAATLIAQLPASVPAIPFSPAPRRDATLAFLVALIVIAEGVVLVRMARGRLPESSTAERVTQRTGLPAVVVNVGGTPTMALTVFYREHLDGAPDITVLHLARRRGHVDLGAVLVRSAALVGVELRLVDLNSGAHGSTDPLPQVTAGRPGVGAVRTLSRSRVDSTALLVLGPLRGPVLIAVDTATTGMADLASGVTALRAAEIDVIGVLVWCGRFPQPQPTFTARRGLLAVVPRLMESPK